MRKKPLRLSKPEKPPELVKDLQNRPYGFIQRIYRRESGEKLAHYCTCGLRVIDDDLFDRICRERA